MGFTQGDKDENEFFKAMGLDTVPEIYGDGGDDAAWEKESDKRLFQLSDSTGKMEFKLVGEKNVKGDLLDSNDVFVFDIGAEVFVWVGKGASKGEKREAMKYAQEYLKKYNRP